MSEMQLMELNLAKLLTQHQSLPDLCDAEPADPFQKATFGKKMRKSKVNASKVISHNLTTYQSSGSMNNPSILARLLQDPHQESEKDLQQKQVERLFCILRSRIQDLEESYKFKLWNLRQSGEDCSREVEEMVGYLEGSVDFIINDCLKEPLLPCKAEEEEKEKSRALNQQHDKENISNNRGTTSKEVLNWKKGQTKPGEKRSKEKKAEVLLGRAEKSIYESVLEERQRRGRKRMI